MHSSTLRGSDFTVHSEGTDRSHAEFFAGTTTATRLGVIAPSPLDALGATSLILASLTAFYDAVRSDADASRATDWRTYPEFYAIQLREPVANYSMLDIWPEHKNVALTHPLPGLAQCVIDRAIDTLLLPAGMVGSPETDVGYDLVHLTSLRRRLQRAYLYGASGEVSDADLAISCPCAPVDSWVEQVASSVRETPTAVWPNPEQTGSVTQTFRQLQIDEAIQHLAACEHGA